MILNPYHIVASLIALTAATNTDGVGTGDSWSHSVLDTSMAQVVEQAAVVRSCELRSAFRVTVEAEQRFGSTHNVRIVVFGAELNKEQAGFLKWAILDDAVHEPDAAKRLIGCSTPSMGFRFFGKKRHLDVTVSMCLRYWIFAWNDGTGKPVGSYFTIIKPEMLGFLREFFPENEELQGLDAPWRSRWPIDLPPKDDS